MHTDYAKFADDSDTVVSAMGFSIEEIPEVEKDSEDITKMGYVDCDKLYLREEASSDSEPITVLEKNEELMIVSEDDPNWYEVYTATGQEGFCMKDFVRID